MAAYCFVRKDGAAESLNTVDKRLCSDLGYKVSEQVYCLAFDLAVQTGFAVLMSMGGGRVDRVVWDAWIEKRRKDWHGPVEFEEFHKEVSALRPYLDGEIYTFEGWR